MQNHNFKNLKAWQLSRSLVKAVYELTATFPSDERYGICSQMRRAAISIPSNIAEGSGRTDKDFHQFLSMSLSSAYELETQLILSADLNLISSTDLETLSLQIQEVQRVVYGFQRKLSATFLGSFFLPIPLLKSLLRRSLILSLASHILPL
ncbi:four helix bundle protein [Fibrella aquatilis]|uniref:Four helix bundle protein n=1 Tax=Fibrella aquatilis TaxID=2817059 RepID=A0A939G5E8_9BACT|nr:four helix bundle protein [Fibrella aquatilis]MBO0930959.1 four helix bundle protein [Fibrella aquatilis]